MLRLVCIFSSAALFVATFFGQEKSPRAQAAAAKPAVDQLIPWLLDEGVQLRGIPFSEVVVDVTGKRLLPFDSKNEADQRVRKAIAAACDETTRRLNAAGSPVQKVTGWDLVDLSQFKVKLKAEFQGSNRDMYRPEATVASSTKE